MSGYTYRTVAMDLAHGKPPTVTLPQSTLLRGLSSREALCIIQQLRHDVVPKDFAFSYEFNEHYKYYWVPKSSVPKHVDPVAALALEKAMMELARYNTILKPIEEAASCIRMYNAPIDTNIATKTLFGAFIGGITGIISTILVFGNAIPFTYYAAGALGGLVAGTCAALAYIGFREEAAAMRHRLDVIMGLGLVTKQ